MDDRWTDRLSEYLDGELTAPELQELEAHLASCADCRTTLDELRAVVRAAASLPDLEPDHDLWAGIEARLGPERTTHGGAAVVSLTERRRRFSFTLPQLAAAGVALMAGSAGLVWLMTTGNGGTRAGKVAIDNATPTTTASTPAAGSEAPAVNGPAAPPALAENPTSPAGREPAGQRSPVTAGRTGATLVSRRAATPEERANREYEQAVSDLERVLRKERSKLRPETVKALEASLADIDRAIADARRALARDPASVYLNAHLAESMRLKLELLQQAATITQS